VRHDLLLGKVAKRVNDDNVMRLLAMILKASGKRGVPQGGVISPLLSNIYLNEVDKMLERARRVTQEGRYTHVEYARYADDLVILVRGKRRHDWLLGAINRRIREEIGKLDVEVNEDKSRTVDMTKGESFGFLGFEFRYVRSRGGAWYPYRTPKLKKRTALLQKLKDIFRRFQSQPAKRIVQLINPILRGWVNYFAIGNSSRCFSFIKTWVEKKIRRHLMRSRKRKGFGWKRWSSQWIHSVLGLFNDYRVRWMNPKAKALPA
jgi:RNA-directed DNA polymerase